jgi:hypothetical protein
LLPISVRLQTDLTNRVPVSQDLNEHIEGTYVIT